jgi:hypothetical protein
MANPFRDLSEAALSELERYVALTEDHLPPPDEATLAEIERFVALTDDDLAAREQLSASLNEDDLAALEKSTGDEVPLDEVVDWIDAARAEGAIYTDDFLAQSQAAAAVLRLALAGDVHAEQAEAIAQEWLEAALVEWARCDQMTAALADMECCEDPLRWRDLLIEALGLMSRGHLAATMAGNQPGSLQ